ncbi:wax ester/triacylglycerol synthase family O-acyltransferase [Hoyosella sp. YIM 151337]|uniref:WS/DGAT/MGAT family O-acyltransferase n=1 Tax=Hoyosella sp. YIM 151337 TaxID=2992742 RepID=UPI00223651CE|nr:wax ester/triacylglycerol synthase family O-acyltransferase [Hoyosella sp. YIM 151337]MCW4353515.1 wax ester/triacylglycerol synthase family O-acyltransferase [Hoyosella sp. YIM 151337]
MNLIAPPDYMFLAMESREHPMHVGGLELFTPPAGAGPDFARNLYERLLAEPEVAGMFRRRVGSATTTPRALTWTDDSDVDLSYHVRLSALPRPGRIRELLETVSLWHSSLLDRHRPLWEINIVEGLEDGRFAVYTKIHHALADGVSALKLLQNTLVTDPHDLRVPSPFAPRSRSDRTASRSTLSALRSAAKLSLDTAAIIPHAGRIGLKAALADQVPLPLRAPRSMFNVPIGGARRFAGQSWRIERLKALSTALDCTLNDVVLGMCSGALRSYLLEQDALPDKPLISLVPVSLRQKGANGSNAVGAVLASLGTHKPDPLDRMHEITRTIALAKDMMGGLSQLQALALSAAFVSPFAISSITGASQAVPPTFNVVISNVPGPTQPLYWNGARLDGIYPASIVMDGLALNITLTSNAENIDFGLVGCRRSVPHLQRLLIHLESALQDLENAVGP